jgi:hypothetical protein
VPKGTRSQKRFLSLTPVCSMGSLKSVRERRRHLSLCTCFTILVSQAHLTRRGLRCVFWR